MVYSPSLKKHFDPFYFLRYPFSFFQFRNKKPIKKIFSKFLL